jgi:hypothetical protein
VSQQLLKAIEAEKRVGPSAEFLLAGLTVF